MSNKKNIFSYSVGKKFIMALTGLFLISFLLVHFAGNLSLFINDGGLAFNKYTLFMTTNPVIRVMELVLVAGFLFHIVDAILLTKENNEARPIKYAQFNPQKNSDWFSRNMGLTGSIVLIFLVLHLKTFWFEYKFNAIPTFELEDGQMVKDMYAIVVTSFQQWWYAGLYVLAMALLSFHLNHGFYSAFQSLGLSNRDLLETYKKIGVALSVLVFIGFSSFPIYFFLIK